MGVSDFQIHQRFKVWLETSLLVVFGCLLAFSTYTLMNDQIWLRYVSEINTDLSPIARMMNIQGDVQQRTRIDTLWLPSKSQGTIYDGDLISTQAESMAEVFLSEKAKIFVESDSLVRLKKLDGKPLIRISQGQIKAIFTEDQVVLIKRGSQIEEVYIRKGTYFIKNEMTAGIQITAFDQGTKKTSNSIEEKYQTKSQGDVDESSPENQQNTLQDQHEFKAPTGISYKLPTPAENTIFLIKEPTLITIAEKQTCPDSCSLLIYRNNLEIQKANFEKDQNSFLSIKISPDQEGIYRWIFETEQSTYEGHFEVRTQTEQNLEKALSSGRPVEML